MDKKIAFFDIDGTLINVPKGLMSPTQETVEVLNTFQKQGNLIFIASARGSLPFQAENLNFDGFIGNDGHYITFNDEVVLDDLFTVDEISKLMAVCNQYKGRSIFTGHQNCWCECWEDQYVQAHQKAFAHSNEKPSNLIEIYQAKDIQALACCVMFESVEALRLAYQALEEDFTMVTYETGIIRMDIYRNGFRKGTAVKYMYEKLGVPKENTYAFGDGINDMEMLQLVGHGIAMGNAIPQLKEVADEVCDDVMANGIANYFKKNLIK